MLRNYLRLRLRLLTLTLEDRTICQAIIAGLTPEGYLRKPLEELQQQSGVGTLETWERLLRTVQSLGPPGLGARDLRECLHLQVDRHAEHATLIHHLIDQHLEDVQQQGDLTDLAQKLGLELTTVWAAAEALHRMNPRPGLTC
jgi:RNA polymerase sigma-54 factor